MNPPVFSEFGNYMELFFEEMGIYPEVIGRLITMIAVYLIGIFLFIFAVYILRAIPVYKMAKKLNIQNPGLAFVPIANSFTFGKIAERYKKKNQSPSAKFGRILLIFDILKFVFSVALIVFTVIMIIKIMGFASIAIDGNSEMTLEMFTSIIPVIMIYIALVIALFTYMIIHYVALWRIFALFDNGNATLFTVISVLFGNIFEIIFMFIVMNYQPISEVKAETFIMDYNEQ